MLEISDIYKDIRVGKRGTKRRKKKHKNKTPKGILKNFLERREILTLIRGKVKNLKDRNKE